MDLELVRAARAGDPAALARLEDRLARLPALVREQHRRLGAPLGPEALADVVQDTLLAVWTKLEGFEGRASLETWMYRFGRNELLKALTHRRRSRETPDPDPAAAAPAREEDGPPLDAGVVHASLEKLDPLAARVVRLRHFENRSFPDIAAETREPLGTVKTRYYRAVDRLRALLAPHWRRAHS